MSFLKKVFFFNLGLAILFLADRLSKHFSLAKLPAEGISLIPDFLNLTVYRNINIAFGIKVYLPLLYILIVLILLLLAILLVKAYQHKNLWLAFWLSLVLVGALSNLVDRLVYGLVIDIIEVPFWSVFNLADCLVVIGLMAWLIKIIWFQKREGQTGE